MNTVNRICFDSFELLPDRRTLLRDGEPVALRGRSFDLLVALVRHAGRVVSRSELLDTVWEGLVVEDNNVAMQVTALRKALKSPLISTVPGRGYCFTGQLRADSPTARPLAPPPLPMTLVPRMFGREHDLADAEHALSIAGCLTLTGPGGVGKTTLAAALRTRGSGRTAWVDLAPLVVGASIWPSLCGALGMAMPAGDPVDVVASALRGFELLVLDNAEHLAAEVAQVAAKLLSVVPGLRLLVTSQVPLRIPGELVRRIEPLTLPPEAMADDEALMHGAIGLLTERVRAADPHFSIDASSLALLRDLCIALDGLPLALEMAAARVPLMGLQEVRSALGQRFSMLKQRPDDGQERHRTLQATMDWSYGLLSPDEQRLLRALAAFVGGFTLDLVASLMTPEDRWEVIDRLATLVDRSLVACDHADPPRYRLLESTRNFALLRLEELGESDSIRNQHASAMATLMQSFSIAENRNVGNQEFRAAFVEVANVRAALQWATHHDALLAVQLATHSALPMILGPWREEALGWMTDCEPLVSDSSVPAALQREWWRVFAMQMMWLRQAHTPEVARRSVALSQQAGDEWNLLWSLIALVRIKTVPDEEMRACAETIRSLLQAHPTWLIRARTLALGALAWVARVDGDYEGCLTLSKQAAELARSTDSARAVDLATLELADALRLAGRSEEALPRLRDIVRGTDGPGDTIVAAAHVSLVRILLSTDRLAEAKTEWPALARRARAFGPEWAELAAFGAAASGHPRKAALLLGFVQALHARRGRSGTGAQGGDIDRATQMVSRHLDAQAAELFIERGRQLEERDVDRLMLADADIPAITSSE